MFPVFLPLTIWCWGAVWYENAATDWSQIKGTGPANSGLIYVAGAVIAVSGAGVLQLVVGLPSNALFRRIDRWWVALLFGLAVALLMAAALSWQLEAKEFGEGALSKIWPMALVFMPPVSIGSLLGWRFEFVARSSDRGAIPTSSEGRAQTPRSIDNRRAPRRGASRNRFMHSLAPLRGANTSPIN